MVIGKLLVMSKEGTVRHSQSKETSILWSCQGETMELLGEKDNTNTNTKTKSKPKPT